MIWDADELTSKATLYFERAFDAYPDEAPFAFWCHLALEHLARAAVAHTHPALLAATNGRSAKSLHVALGVDTDFDPLLLESVTATEVTRLCAQHVTGFRGTAEKSFERVLRRRNAELHSAHPAMEELPDDWRGSLFAVVNVLIRHLEIELDDVLGEESASLAKRLTVEDSERVQGQVTKLIRDAQRRKGASDPIPQLGGYQPPVTKLPSVRCPACKESGTLAGEFVSSGPAVVNEDNELVEREVYLPTYFGCEACGLEIVGNAPLSAAQIGHPVLLEQHLDPKETFNIGLDDFRDEFFKELAEDYAYTDE